MSTKHLIDKLLEEPAGPQIPREKITGPESTIPHCGELSKDEMSDYHRRNNYVVHVPRECRTPIYCSPYLSQNSFCHSRPTKCLCPTCTQDVPPWLVDMRTPRFIDSVPGYQPHLRRSYMAARWDTTRFANSSVVTRAKQQPCLMSAGGQKRKKRHRTAFTPTQLLGLENAFEQNQYSVGEERKQLASFLGLSETQIKVWFQNRRTKWKRIRKEAEQMSTDDDERDGNETENLMHHTRQPHYQIYEQHHTETRISADELCACEKMWPTGHAYRGPDGY